MVNMTKEKSKELSIIYFSFDQIKNSKGIISGSPYYSLFWKENIYEETFWRDKIRI